MAWEYRCPYDGCEFTASANDERDLVEAAQQHVGDRHGDLPTRDEVEPYVIGPG